MLIKIYVREDFACSLENNLIQSKKLASFSFDIVWRFKKRFGRPF